MRIQIKLKVQSSDLKENGEGKKKIKNKVLPPWGSAFYPLCALSQEQQNHFPSASETAGCRTPRTGRLLKSSHHGKSQPSLELIQKHANLNEQEMLVWDQGD